MMRLVILSSNCFSVLVRKSSGVERRSSMILSMILSTNCCMSGVHEAFGAARRRSIISNSSVFSRRIPFFSSVSSDPSS